jgi:3-deoxy-D-manno-octulosonic acid (KDO) 8-phosphate synthase
MPNNPLVDLIRQGESQTLEFKASFDKATRYSVAFVLREGVNEGVSEGENGGVARTFGIHPIHLIAQEQGILL